MDNTIGKITPKKVPASQAIPGNPEHAKLLAKAQKVEAVGDGASWSSRIKTSLLGPSLFGLVVLLVFFAGFGFWAASAPLSGAAISTGVVTASGQNFTVQHFEGGIIETILVKEGDKVSKGQPLLKLDATSALSERDRLSKGLISMQARANRLEAERDGAAEVKFDEDLIYRAVRSESEEALDEQRREFQKRRRRYESDAAIIDQQVGSLEQQITGYNVQMRSVKDQIAVLNDEISVKKKLVERKLTPRSEFLRLVRSRSELEGRLGGYISSIGEARSSITQAAERKLRLGAEAAETAVSALNDLRVQITDNQERTLRAENVLKRVVVSSPADGIVVDVARNTPGSVVRQGEDLFVILPAGGELIVEARLSPADIDAVSVGQTANLRFSSLNSRTTPEVSGEVIYVSADRLVEAATNESYYVARLKIADVLPANLTRDKILPGMPVETYISTGDRTFLEYLVKPLSDSFSRAFREE